MASTLTENSVAGDMLIFDSIINKTYRNIEPATMKTLRRMVRDGVIQVDALVEKAISVVGRVQRDSTEGRDFVDGSDAKKVTTGWRIERAGNRKLKTDYIRRVADVTGIANKRGTLRVIVAETMTDQLYYFKIPGRQYRGLSTISIYFNADGTPKLSGRWFRYQCRSFTEMAR
jgi:hypothetical protein